MSGKGEGAQGASGLPFDDDGPHLPGHHDVSYDLGTPRQYTARGGWNVSCECGETFAESGDEDLQDRWLRHLNEVASRHTAT